MLKSSTALHKWSSRTAREIVESSDVEKMLNEISTSDNADNSDNGTWWTPGGRSRMLEPNDLVGGTYTQIEYPTADNPFTDGDIAKTAAYTAVDNTDKEIPPTSVDNVVISDPGTTDAKKGEDITSENDVLSVQESQKPTEDKFKYNGNMVELTANNKIAIAKKDLALFTKAISALRLGANRIDIGDIVIQSRGNGKVDFNGQKTDIKTLIMLLNFAKTR